MMKLKEIIKSEYEFDKMLTVLDSYAYARYTLKLTSEEIEILKNRSNDAIRESEGKIYYKGHHKIERVDINE